MAAESIAMPFRVITKVHIVARGSSKRPNKHENTDVETDIYLKSLFEYVIEAEAEAIISNNFCLNHNESFYLHAKCISQFCLKLITS